MHNNNHYGLVLAILVAGELQEVEEECRDAWEAIAGGSHPADYVCF